LKENQESRILIVRKLEEARDGWRNHNFFMRKIGAKIAAKNGDLKA